MRADKQEIRGKANMRTAKTFYAASLFFEILQNFDHVHADIEQKQKYAAWRAAEIRKACRRKDIMNSGRNQPSEALLSVDKAFPPTDDKIISPAQSDQPVIELPSESLHLQDSSLLHDSGQEQLLSPTKASLEGSNDPIPIFPMTDNLLTSPNNWDVQNEMDDLDDYEETFYDCSEHDLSSVSSSDSEYEEDQLNTIPLEVRHGHYRPSASEILKAHKAAKLAVSALAFEDVSSAISYLEEALALLTLQESSK
ncbi:hypothetical protein KP509_07G028300 [Ceratopteris richardii]|nr:hypothetical protein KP509_07G028300 [Ceratopteris richardii]